MAKLQIISEDGLRFGGLAFIHDNESYKKLLELCDKELGIRSQKGGGYSYSEVLNAFFMSVFAGGTSVEDVNKLVPELKQYPDLKAPSADTVLRTLKELSVSDETVRVASSDKEYLFNRNKRLNELLLKGTISLGFLKKGEACDFDYDNQIIATKKQDAIWTYKEVKGYAPGIAFANGQPFYIEGRSGNSGVVLDQATTLTNAYEALLKEGIRVRRSRMDAGSYTKEVVRVVEKYSDFFYIRSKQTQYYNALVNESTRGWRQIELPSSNGGSRPLEVRSVDTTEFIPGKTYRVVLYRYKDGWADKTFFNEDEAVTYRYFGIITNDFEKSEEEIVRYYNGRGAIERVFDQMNNDFNWAHLPSSDMSHNTAFMQLTALLRNFYVKYVEELSKCTGGLIHKRSRLKAFIFHFVTLPAMWVKKKVDDVLQLFGVTKLQRRYIERHYAT